MPLRIAYLTNVYPKVSHSFIRREIQAMEDLGVQVERIAVRGWDETLVDPQDIQERAHTSYVLARGLPWLLGAAVRVALARPARFLQALALAARRARRSDRSALHHALYLAEACVVARWALQRGVRHLHAHFGTNPADVAMLAALLADIPYSFTAHGSEETDRAPLIGLADKIARAAFVVAVSSFGRSQLFRWVAHAHWHKIEVVHCGLGDELLQAPADAPPDIPRLVCVGRLSEQKGQLLLVSALRRVLDRGLACQLVLAGDGEMRADVQALIDRLGVQAHVRITGWLSGEQVVDELRAARALVLPSFIEGLPVVAMEAMAVGRPVLATWVAGVPELVVHGETGWLFAPGDVEALADAMQACLAARPPELARMGEAAARRVRERHDVKVEAGKLLRLLHQGPGSAAGAEP